MSKIRTIRLVQAGAPQLVIDGESVKEWHSFDEPVELLDTLIKVFEDIGVKVEAKYLDMDLSVYELSVPEKT